MARFLKSRARKKGLPPGTLISPFAEVREDVEISLIHYKSDFFEEKKLTTFVENLDIIQSSEVVSWLDIDGLSDIKPIEDVGKAFGIHSLWLEDVLNLDHRPKVAELNHNLFVIIKAVKDLPLDEGIQFEQVSLILNKNFLLSFQEKTGDIFKGLKNRIKEKKGKIREKGADYLFYSCIDSILDDYFSCLEQIGKEIESLELKVAEQIQSDLPDIIMSYKRELLYLGKAAIPIRDSLSHIVRSQSPDIASGTQIYFQDALEHSTQVVEVIEEYKQLLSSILDFYQSKVTIRTNEVMKVLALFSSIFIPLTFIVGVYGMNFEFMPELHWKYGYGVVWTLMLILASGMVYYFKKRDWL